MRRMSSRAESQPAPGRLGDAEKSVHEQPDCQDDEDWAPLPDLSKMQRAPLGRQGMAEDGMGLRSIQNDAASPSRAATMSPNKIGKQPASQSKAVAAGSSADKSQQAAARRRPLVDCPPKSSTAEKAPSGGGHIVTAGTPSRKRPASVGQEDLASNSKLTKSSPGATPRQGGKGSNESVKNQAGWTRPCGMECEKKTGSKGSEECPGQEKEQEKVDRVAQQMERESDQDRADALQQKLAAAMKEITDTKLEIENGRKFASTAEAELKTLRLSLAQLRTEHENLTKLNTSLKESNNEHKANVTKLQKDLVTARCSGTQLKQLEKDVARLTADNAALRMKDKNAEKEKEGLVEQAQKAEQTAEDAASKLEDAKGKIAALEGQVREKDVQISELERANREEKAKTSKASDDLYQFKATSELSTANVKEAHKKELSDVGRERDKAQAEASVLRKKVAELEESIDAEKTSASRLQDELCKTKTSKDKTEAQNAKLEAQIKTVSTELAEQRTQLRDQEVKYEKLVLERAAAKQEAEDAQRKNRHLERKNKAFSEEFPDKLKRMQDVMSTFVAEYCDVVYGTADSQVVGGGVGGGGASGGGGVRAGDGVHLRGGIADSGGSDNGKGPCRMSGIPSDGAQADVSAPMGGGTLTYRDQESYMQDSYGMAGDGESAGAGASSGGGGGACVAGTQSDGCVITKVEPDPEASTAKVKREGGGRGKRKEQAANQKSSRGAELSRGHVKQEKSAAGPRPVATLSAPLGDSQGGGLCPGDARAQRAQGAGAGHASSEAAAKAAAAAEARAPRKARKTCSGAHQGRMRGTDSLLAESAE